MSLEHDPLLPISRRRRQTRNAASIIPFTLLIALIHGLSSTPQLEVVLHLSCRSLHSDYSPRTGPASHSHHHRHLPILPPTTPPVLQLPPPCLANPDAAAAASHLQTLIAGATGILALFTLRYWFRTSPLRVFSLSALGLLVTNTLYFLTTLTPHAPLLFLSPLPAGILPGPAALTCTVLSALLSFLPSPTSSSIPAIVLPLTRLTGLVSFAYALGALLSSFLLSPTLPHSTMGSASPATRLQTHAGPALLFSMALAGCTALAAYLLEEGPDRKGKGRAIEPISQDSESEFGQGVFSPGEEQAKSGSWGVFYGFRPALVMDLKGSWRWDYSVPTLASALGVVLISMGITRPRLFYAAHTFTWDGAHLAALTTLLSFIRAIYLTFALPYFFSAMTIKSPPQKKKTKLNANSNSNVKIAMAAGKSKPFTVPNPQYGPSGLTGGSLSGTATPPAKGSVKSMKSTKTSKAKTLPAVRYTIKSRAIPFPYGNTTLPSSGLKITHESASGSVSQSGSTSKPTAVSKPPTVPTTTSRISTATPPKIGLDARTLRATRWVVMCSILPEMVAFLYLSCASVLSWGGETSTNGGGVMGVGVGAVGFVRLGVLCVLGSGAGPVIVGVLLGLVSGGDGDIDTGTDPSAERVEAIGYILAGAMLIGPVLFGLTYTTTALQFPNAFFAVGAFVLLIGLFAILRIKPVGLGGDSASGKGRKKVEKERGRSTACKDLRGEVV